MASSLLALLDDIATLLDDVAVMGKLAAKKTTGVLGDDLALSAQQVAGIRAERELPVIWAVGLGSLRNKAILVPSALLVSAFAPWAILPFLMLGGAYLCFEGVEKLAHRFLHAPDETPATHEAESGELTDMAAFEAERIRGAVRTDFILSAEIIVISLGTLASAPMLHQVLALTAVALVMTVGVYGVVAAIVKLDDAGLWLLRREGASALSRALGRFLLGLAPRLMKVLSFVGTLAMFLVGGGILAHGLPGFEAWLHHLAADGAAATAVGLLADLLVGVAAGAVVLAMVGLASRVGRLVRR